MTRVLSSWSRREAGETGVKSSVGNRGVGGGIEGDCFTSGGSERETSGGVVEEG